MSRSTRFESDYVGRLPSLRFFCAFFLSPVRHMVWESASIRSPAAFFKHTIHSHSSFNTDLLYQFLQRGETESLGGFILLAPGLARVRMDHWRNNNFQGKTRYTRRKTCHNTTLSTIKSVALLWDWTSSSQVRSRRLCAGNKALRTIFITYK